MNAATQNKQTFLVGLLSLAAIGLLVAIFYVPTWWVSLTAPNYPEEAFPDGVKIHFHMNGVFNGCSKIEKAEITEEVALDCVHEMDTINHYVGMYPIAAGGPVERGFSQFLMVFLGVMLLGFVCVKPKIRLAIMGLGFAAIAAWMYLTLYGENGLNLQNPGYVEALVTSLDQEASSESGPEIVIGGIVGVLRDSLEESGVSVELPSQESGEAAGTTNKEQLIEQLQLNYEKDLEHRRVEEPWNGSALQVMTWHYAKSLGRYFNNQEEIRPMVKNLNLAINVVFAGLIGAMLLLLFGARKNSGLLYWLLVLVPAALPVFFIIDYSAWLWWYGHTLNDMGAFSVKPFMPTVFGQGKVAQFATHSYPSIGFGVMMLVSALLAVAALIRKKQFAGAR
jgi:cytochrome c-type biogenesis protein CcmE